MNKIEYNTVMALNYISKRVIYVIDSSETCGYTLKTQLRCLSNIMNHFDIIQLKILLSKTDLCDNAVLDKIVINIEKEYRNAKIYRYNYNDENSLREIKSFLIDEVMQSMKSYKKKKRTTQVIS